MVFGSFQPDTHHVEGHSPSDLHSLYSRDTSAQLLSNIGLNLSQLSEKCFQYLAET